MQDQEAGLPGQDKDNDCDDDNELLPQSNQNKRKASSDDKAGGSQGLGDLPVFPDPPSSSSLASIQDDEPDSTPTLGFDEDDQVRQIFFSITTSFTQVCFSLAYRKSAPSDT